MYEVIIILGSLVVGWFLARITKEELKPGEKWFKLLCNIILGVFVFWMLFYEFSLGMLIGIVAGLILGFFIFNPYLYLGILGMMTYFGFNRELFSILGGLFGLSYMGLYYKKADWKIFVFCACLFLLPYSLLAFNNDYKWLWYGIIIGGVFHVVRENYSRD